MVPGGLGSRSEEALDRCAVSICRPEPQQKAPSAPPPPPPPPPPPLPEPAPPEPEEEILGSDDEEQEDPADYCKGEGQRCCAGLKLWNLFIQESGTALHFRSWCIIVFSINFSLSHSLFVHFSINTQVQHSCVLPDVPITRIESKLPLILVSCKRNRISQTKANSSSRAPKGSKMPWCP